MDDDEARRKESDGIRVGLSHNNYILLLLNGKIWFYAFSANVIGFLRSGDSAWLPTGEKGKSATIEDLNLSIIRLFCCHAKSTLIKSDRVDNFQFAEGSLRELRVFNIFN